MDKKTVVKAVLLGCVIIGYCFYGECNDCAKEIIKLVVAL